MDNKKSKKKLFAIIGSSVLAFVLTVVVSVAVTLAYFGGTDQKTNTATMDKEVTVGLTTESETIAHVLPGEKVEVDATATVAAGVSGGFVAIKLTVETDAGSETLAAPTVTLTDGSTWTKVGNYYYYTTTAGTDNTALLKQVADTETAELTGSFVVDKTLDNKYAEATITVTFDVIVVQGEAFDAQGNAIAQPTIADALEMFDQFDDSIVA